AQDVAVVAGSRLALIGVADQVLLHRRVARHEAPLRTRREGGAAAAAQPRSLDRVDDRVARRLLPQDLLPYLVAADLAVGVERPRLLEVHRLEQQQVHFLGGVGHFNSSSTLSIFSGVRCSWKT